MKYDFSMVSAITDGQPVNPRGTRRARIVLGKGDWAWNPGSTKRMIPGPTIVTYVHHWDGGWDHTTETRMTDVVVREFSETTVGKCAVCDSATGWRAALIDSEGDAIKGDWYCRRHTIGSLV